MRINLLFTFSIFLALVEEHLTIFNSAVELSLCIVNHTDLLVALCLDVFILILLCNVERLLVELERHFKLVVLKVLIGNLDIDSYQIL